MPTTMKNIVVTQKQTDAINAETAAIIKRLMATIEDEIAATIRFSEAAKGKPASKESIATLKHGATIARAAAENEIKRLVSSKILD
jgi:hypothetical protein